MHECVYLYTCDYGICIGKRREVYKKSNLEASPNNMIH